MKKNFSRKIKETYYPFWEDMKNELEALGINLPSEHLVTIESVLIKAYMNALEIGFNEGVNWEKQTTKDEENKGKTNNKT